MSRPAHTRAATSPTPEQTWTALAPLLAARGRMRVSRDGGRNYKARGERIVTTELPNQPAAVLVYDKAGRAPVICLDLDSSRGDVERDLAAIEALLRRFKASWFSDSSPNGGRHVYIPLAEPAPYTEARAFVLALQARTPTLDPQPMLNITAGCLRPPGARHRTGGHQLLDGSIAAAVAAIRQPTPTDSWRQLLTDATRGFEERRAQHEAPAAPAVHNLGHVDEDQTLEALHGHRAPDADFTAIARTGDYPASRYRSPSEARQGVVWACAAAGWSLVDVVRRVEDGTWPGLASFYARYPQQHRRAALTRDWRHAIEFERRRRERKTQNQGPRSVRIRTTSTQQTQAGAPRATATNLATSANARGLTVNQEVRVWLAAVDFLSPTLDVGTKAVLYALAQAAICCGRLEVENGNRFLAEHSGLDQSTVGRILAELRTAPPDRQLIDLVRPADRTRAHTYALVVPALLRPAAERKPWRRGRVYAIRPVFRELGMVAAFVYGVLEIAQEPLGGREVARLAGVGHTAAYEALAALAAWGLAEPGKGGWRVGAASPKQLGEHLGCDEQVAEQVARHRAERLAWWHYLGIIDEQPASILPLPMQEPSAPKPEPPPPRFDYGLFDTDPLVELLRREMGAVVIAVEPLQRIGYRNR